MNTEAGLVVLVGPSALVVVERDRTELVVPLRVALGDSAPLDGVLAALTAHGVRNLPDFAFAGREGTSLRLLLRGSLTARVRDQGGKEWAVTAQAVSSWSEAVLEHIREVEISVPNMSGGEPLAMMVMSSVEPPVVSDSSDGREDEDDNGDNDRLVTSAETMLGIPELFLSDAEPGGDPDIAAEPEEPEDDGLDLSHLFETRYKDVESAAVRPQPIDETPDAESRDGELPDSEPVPTPSSATAPPQTATPVPDFRSGIELIAGVPGVMEPDGSPGDHDGLTITAAALAEVRRSLRADVATSKEEAPGYAQVQAVLCEAGHLNPPHAGRCRSCAGRITDRSIHVVPRPSLGRFEFEGGMVVDLDRPLLIGRKPSTESLGAVGELPGLVSIPDPESVLSRVHVEVRLDGWEVLVVDQDSLNGTFVQLPGQEPQMLRPHDPCLIVSGTTVRLGDLTSCMFRVEAN